MPVELGKLQKEAPELVSLAKEAETQLTNFGLQGHEAKVALCLDNSGSMGGFYNAGLVQRVAERVLALGTRFDDDGAIDVFGFGSSAAYLGELTISNYKGGVDNLIRKCPGGSTDYAGAMSLVRQHFLGTGGGAGLPALQGAGKKIKGMFKKTHQVAEEAPTPGGPLDMPIYVLFLTDGEPNSRPAAQQQLVQASAEGIFWCFVGIGSNASAFSFLSELDNLPGRTVDNAFFFADDLTSPDEDVYQAMLMEYGPWVKAAQGANIIR